MNGPGGDAKADSASLGSLGIAIAKAVEVATTDMGTKYCLVSMLNHQLCMCRPLRLSPPSSFIPQGTTAVTHAKPRSVTAGTCPHIPLLLASVRRVATSPTELCAGQGRRRQCR
jgi:hypothetical protein